MGFTTPSGTEITSKPGLLVSLAKYAPRPQSNPKENFLTEAFAYLLRIPDSRVGCVAAELLSELTERDFEPAPCPRSGMRSRSSDSPFVSDRSHCEKRPNPLRHSWINKR